MDISFKRVHGRCVLKRSKSDFIEKIVIKLMVTK